METEEIPIATEDPTQNDKYNQKQFFHQKDELLSTESQLKTNGYSYRKLQMASTNNCNYPNTSRRSRELRSVYNNEYTNKILSTNQKTNDTSATKSSSNPSKLQINNFKNKPFDEKNWINYSRKDTDYVRTSSYSKSKSNNKKSKNCMQKGNMIDGLEFSEILSYVKVENGEF